MPKTLSNRRGTLLLLILLSLICNHTMAQLPQYGLVYINFHKGLMVSDSMYVYDPSLPVSATNPYPDSIRLPPNNAGLAVSPVIGNANHGDNRLTFYTTVNDSFVYYDPSTSQWIYTHHFIGTTSAVNIGAGGGFVYSLIGFGFGTAAYKYDGNGDATWVSSISSPLPYDLVADCEGSYYIVSLIGPMWSMTKYSSSGAILQGYTFNNPQNYHFSGGMGMIGNNLYFDDINARAVAHGVMSGNVVTMDSLTAQIPYMLQGYDIADMATAPTLLGGLPSVTITASDTSVCAGGQITFVSHSANAGATPQYQWYVDSTAVAGATDSVFTYTPAANSTVYLQMVGNSGCSDMTVTSNPINIHILPPPTVSFTLTPSACAGDTVIAVVDTPANIIYNWNFNGATIVNGAGAGPYELIWNTAGAYTVALQAVQDGCIANSTETTTIHSQPMLQLSATESSICNGDTAQVTAVASGANAIQWLLGNNSTLIDSSRNSINVWLLQSSYIGAIATTEYGCTTTDSVLVNTHSCCHMMVPNAFTPNGDGENDVFAPVPSRRYKVLSLLVENRWGQPVYYSTRDIKGWDGMFSGVPQEIGTYFYTLTYTCEGSKDIIRKSGDVTLIR